MNKYKIKGFTLVELIVVITILSILGTIGFISLQGYGALSRDSVRIANISNIKKGLELFYVKSSYYPEPSDSTGIVYSGSTAWTQGTLGDSVIREVDSFSNPFLDPLTNKPNSYSVTNSRKEYQIGTFLESREVGLNNTNTTYANNGNKKAYVDGNYNGNIITIKKNQNLIILTVPSILASDITDVNLIDIINNNKLVFNGYSNLPANSKTDKINPNSGTGEILVNKNILVYSGALKGENSISDNQNIRIEVLEKIQKAYSGTILKNKSGLKLISSEPVNSTNAVAVTSVKNLNLLANVLNHNLYTKIKLLPSIPTDWDTIPNNYAEYFNSSSIYTKNWNNQCTNMNIVTIESGTDISGLALASNTVYKIKEGEYTITSPILLNDCSGLIGEGNVKLINDGNINIISGSSKHGLIVSNITLGDNSGTNGNYLLLISSGEDVSINNLKTSYGKYGIYIDHSPKTRLNNIVTHDNTNYGIMTYYSDSSILSNIKTYLNGTYGFYVHTSPKTELYNIRTYKNNSYGYRLHNSPKSVLNNIISHNQGGCGTYHDYSDYTVVNNSTSFSQGCYGFRIVHNNNFILNNATTYTSHSGPYAYSGTNVLYNNIISYSGLRNDSGKYYGKLSANTVSSMTQGLSTDPLISNLHFTDGVYTDNGNNVDTDYVTTAIGDYDENLFYHYGNKVPKQTRPIRYSDAEGKFIYYGRDGVEYNSHKYITEW